MRKKLGLFVVILIRFIMGLIWLSMFYFTMLGLLVGLLNFGWTFMLPIMLALGFWNIFKLTKLWDSN